MNVRVIAAPCSPTRALALIVRARWRQRRCLHLDWDPLTGPCPGCGGNW
jgi:hypothetical protein